jgi:iron complex transport system ATP-binding protein
MAFLQVNSLSLRIGTTQVCRDLNLQLSENQRWGLLGKNGVGKTTLLHSLIGLLPAQSGEILIGNTPLKSIPRQELAVAVGILFQHGINEVPATVMETVLLGRHPHVQSLLRDDPADVEIALEALHDLQLGELAERQVDTLSGGERQRLALAMLIAQTPKLFLLDEPSNHLDLAFQVELLSILDRKLKQYSASLIMATHDINLVARFCEYIVLLLGNGEFVQGPTRDVLTAKNLSSAFDCEIVTITAEGRTFFYPN